MANRKLTAEQVIKIREAYAQESITQLGLAHQYGVTRQTIADIISRATWLEPKTLKQRFMEKVVKGQDEDSCWLWQGAVDGSGYGVIKANGTQQQAHRVAYQYMVNGGKPIPPGMFICHRCDEPSCVNPKHLWLGTHQDNMADRNNKGRQASKLNPAQVKLIRRLHKQGHTCKAIAERMGVTPAPIEAVMQGKAWQHVP